MALKVITSKTTKEHQTNKNTKQNSDLNKICLRSMDVRSKDSQTLLCDSQLRLKALKTKSATTGFGIQS